MLYIYIYIYIILYDLYTVMPRYDNTNKLPGTATDPCSSFRTGTGAESITNFHALHLAVILTSGRGVGGWYHNELKVHSF
jgi:hypothetical protein